PARPGPARPPSGTGSPARPGRRWRWPGPPAATRSGRRRPARRRPRPGPGPAAAPRGPARTRRRAAGSWRTPCSRRGRTERRSGDRTGSRSLLGTGTAHRGERAAVETVGERGEVAVAPPGGTAWQIQRLHEPRVAFGGQPELVGRQGPPGQGLVAPPEPLDEAGGVGR